MLAEQISVFLENKSGRLAEVARILAEAQINIRALSIADTSDFGVLRLIVNDNEKAQALLKENGFTVRKTQVVAVEVPDKPGGLLDVLNIVDRARINIEYMYAYASPKGGGNAVMIFRFDPMEQALKVLTDNGLRIMPAQTLYSV